MYTQGVPDIASHASPMQGSARRDLLELLCNLLLEHPEPEDLHLAVRNRSLTSCLYTLKVDVNVGQASCHMCLGSSRTSGT
jgi:hypothetical protein